jgi:hypothetical protein
MKFVRFAWTSEWQYGWVQYMTSIYIFDRSWNVDFIGTPNIATNTLLLMFTCHQDDWCFSFITSRGPFWHHILPGETRQYGCRWLLKTYIAWLSRSFDYARTWWLLFQKHVVRTKFYNYVFYYYHWANTSAMRYKSTMLDRG